MSRFPGKPGARPYNGFTPAERQQKMQSVKAAIASGEIKQTRTCSVCEQTFPYAVGFHSERYDDPLAVYPVCRSCHYMIHIRFWRPGQWITYIAQLDADGWFQRLSLDPRALSRPFSETYPNGLGQ